MSAKTLAAKTKKLPNSAVEAQAAGYEVDRHCYPWIAYKGPRFRPTEHHHILTDNEAEMLEALKDIVEQFEATRLSVGVDLADSIRVFGKGAIAKVEERKGR